MIQQQKAKNSLVIVESPAKCATISQYLQYSEVIATYGHVTAIPSKTSSINFKDFSVKRAIVAKKKVLNDIVYNAKKADIVYLACDYDREGESIAYDVQQIILKHVPNCQIKRITFTEITKKAILEAVENAHDIDQLLISAQRARSCVDFLFGIWLSKLLFKKVCHGISGGRVQSPALIAISDRQQQIDNFIPETYYNFYLKTSLGDLFLVKIADKTFTKTKDPDPILKDLNFKCKNLIFNKVIVKKRLVHPNPPFTTSFLQKEAYNKFSMSIKKVSSILQKLYEGLDINGKKIALITYPRTDSFKLSSHIIEQISKKIIELYSQKYLQVRNIASKKNAQESHEAIRPVDMSITPAYIKQFVNKSDFCLYEMIYNRTLASQMKSSTFKIINVQYKSCEYLFQTSKSFLVDNGFQVVYGQKSVKDDENIKNYPSDLTVEKIVDEKHITKPKPKLNPASLIGYLEDSGVGRPSTYSYAVDVLIERNFVHLKDKAFHLNDVGKVTAQFFKKYFTYYTSVEFTAKLEQELSKIVSGDKKYIQVVKPFWSSFIKQLEEVEKTASKQVTFLEGFCPSCNKFKLCQDIAKRGFFIRCSSFLSDKSCKYIEDHNQATDKICPKCSSPIVIRKGRYGKFYGCSKFPSCRHIEKIS